MIGYKVEKGKPFPMGASLIKDGVAFSMFSDSPNCGLILKNKSTKDIIRIPFNEDYKYGNIYSVNVKYLDFSKYVYRFYKDGKEFADPFSQATFGNEKFGIKKDYELYSIVSNQNDFDWKNDKNPLIPYEDCVLYLLHVRGFSAHSSSKVTNKGTIQGIIQKIPYLKELGITSLELMPVYEFEEFSKSDNTSVPNENYVTDYDKVNYWGYKEGYYFAPKASYCATKNPVNEYKEFVRILHDNNLEVIMQFYFPDFIEEYKIYEVLRFWKINYHIDGFHLKGNKIPFTLIAKDPLFGDTKLFYDYIPENEIYEAAKLPKVKNLCTYSDAFMYQMRKVLKGDEDTLKDLIYYTKFSPEKSACVNFITNYYGFTLNDLVSYDRKHNEDNGEKNADGCDYNFSWNCGIEGKTKKASIVKLRKRMMKNALFLVFSSKGVPLIFAGDEICNSQNGNNNPYCQDNSISYINWNLNEDSKEMYEYTKNLIEFRKQNLVKLLNREFSMLDRNGIGFPDLSYHSDEAWKADLATYNRHLGIMYSDCDKDSNKISLYYLAYNFYWKDVTFSLPYLPQSLEWNLIFKTGKTDKIKLEDEEANKGDEFEIEARSCSVFKVEFDKSILKTKNK